MSILAVVGGKIASKRPCTVSEGVTLAIRYSREEVLQAGLLSEMTDELMPSVL